MDHLFHQYAVCARASYPDTRTASILSVFCTETNFLREMQCSQSTSEWSGNSRDRKPLVRYFDTERRNMPRSDATNCISIISMFSCYSRISCFIFLLHMSTGCSSHRMDIINLSGALLKMCKCVIHQDDTHQHLLTSRSVCPRSHEHVSATHKLARSMTLCRRVDWNDMKMPCSYVSLK